MKISKERHYITINQNSLTRGSMWEPNWFYTATLGLQLSYRIL